MAFKAVSIVFNEKATRNVELMGHDQQRDSDELSVRCSL